MCVCHRSSLTHNMLEHNLITLTNACIRSLRGSDGDAPTVIDWLSTLERVCHEIIGAWFWNGRTEISVNNQEVKHIKVCNHWFHLGSSGSGPQDIAMWRSSELLLWHMQTVHWASSGLGYQRPIMHHSVSQHFEVRGLCSQITVDGSSLVASELLPPF